MECREKGYRGGDPFLLLDFCYDEAPLVYPIAERLVMEGVRVWFRSDKGADPEEERLSSERMKNCGACLFVLSARSSDWPPLLARTVFAFIKKKPVVFVSLEKGLQKTVGLMKQAEYALELDASDAEFYQKLLASPAVAACRESGVKPDESRLREWRARSESFRREYEAEQERDHTEHLSEIISPVPVPVAAAPEKPAKEEPKKEEPKKEEPKKEEPKKDEPKADPNAAVCEPPENKEPAFDPNATVYEPPTKKKLRSVIVRLSNGEVRELKKPVVTLGRSSDEEKQADITFDNAYGVSRFHAVLTELGGRWLLRDDKSTFGTFVDGRELPRGETVPIGQLEVFRLRDEEFCLVQGQAAEELLTAAPQAALEKLRELRAPKAAQQVEEPEEEDPERTIYEPRRKPQPKPPEQDEPIIVDLGDDEEKTVAATAGIDDLIDDEMTVRVARKPAAPENDPEATVRQTVLPAAILRVNTGELFRLQQIETIIGRRSERRRADIMLDGNDELSRHHAVIYQYQGRFMLRDCESARGTFIGGERVSHEKATDLPDLTVFTLENEDFVFLQGESLKFVQTNGVLGLLSSVDTGETKAVAEQDLSLDRRHPWKGGLLQEKNEEGKYLISKNHALLGWGKSSFMIRDLGSTNSTYVNNRKLEPGGDGVKLSDGDRISIYDVKFTFREVKLK